MKGIKTNWLKALMVLMVIMAIFSTSCKDDDDDDPKGADYVGKWSSEVHDTTSMDEDYKDMLTLTVNTFDNMIQMQNSEGTWVNSIQVKGSMTVSGNLMNIHVSEIGMSDIDEDTGEFTGNMTTYKEGSLFFGIIMAEIDQEADFQSEYAVVGNKLTLSTDMNDDGDFNDLNETTVYTRQ